MVKPKACKNCKIIYEGDKCPKCGAESSEATESWKGKVAILNPKQSEIAKKLKVNERGTYAIKTK